MSQPEYGTVYPHQGMLLQNLHRSYLYIVIRLPKLKDLDQKIPAFTNCDNYSVHRSSIQILQVMMLNSMIMPYTSKYALILRLTIEKKWILLSRQ